MNEIGRNLKRVRLLRSLSLRQAGALLNMSAPMINKYEKGETIPNSEKLIEFANAYNVKTIELLKSYNLPEMKFTSFRKKKKLVGGKFELLKEMIREEVAKYFEVLELSSVENNEVSLPTYSCSSFEDVEKASEKFREEVIKISSKLPISDLISILENLGIIIISIKNIDNMFKDFDGFSEMVNGKPVIVLLDDMVDGARQRFTIAHELGHLVLNINDNCKADEEKLCNRFASSLLMPKNAVFNEFSTSRNNISFYELEAFKWEYKVSYAAIAYRLKDLNIINESLYTKISIYLNKNINKNDPKPVLPEKSYQFKKAIYRLWIDSIISITRACELLGVDIDEFNRENNNYGY